MVSEVSPPGSGWPRRPPAGGELLEQIVVEHGWRIVAKEVMPDHVHVFVRVGPADAPAAVVRVFEGRTARVLRQEFPHVRRFRRCCGRRRISPPRWGYASESMVHRYIELQWDAVMAS